MGLGYIHFRHFDLLDVAEVQCISMFASLSSGKPLSTMNMLVCLLTLKRKCGIMKDLFIFGLKYHLPVFINNFLNIVKLKSEWVPLCLLYEEQQ